MVYHYEEMIKKLTYEMSQLRAEVAEIKQKSVEVTIENVYVRTNCSSVDNLLSIRIFRAIKL